MISLLKLSLKRPGRRIGAIAGLWLIAFWGALSSAQAPRGALMINSIPFGEMNGRRKYNASDIIPIADSRFLFCDNNTNDALFELDLTPDGREKGPLIRRPLRGLAAGAADDLEGMALVEEGGRRYVFITSSMRVRSAKDDSLFLSPSGVLRVAIGPEEPDKTPEEDATLAAENMPDFRDWLIRAYPQLAASARIKPDEGGLNIEGLAWDRNRHALLFGLRTPEPDGKPLILPVKVKNLAGPWTTGNLEAQAPIHLSIEPLGYDQGIRGLYNKPDREDFLAIIGKATKGSQAPYSLYQWNGDAGGAARRLNVVFARKMKPEGITRGMIGGRAAFVIVDDAGGFQVIWDDKNPLQVCITYLSATELY
jgi:hypothetical protein